MIQIVAKKTSRWILLALIGLGITTSCQDIGKIPVRTATSSSEPHSSEFSTDSIGHLDPLLRYGGYAITAIGMPHDRYSAYLWAKNLGTLVSYETFLRKYSDGDDAKFFREEIRKKFVPEDDSDEWGKAWLLYSKMEIIDGAICDPKKGFILIGRPGTGKLPPFFFEDLIAALKCSLSKEKVGVTMTRIFPARNTVPDNPRQIPYESYETSVEFFSTRLWNTHLAYLLFEGDRELKSLAHGYDIFLREPTRSKVPGFATIVEMASLEPSDPAGGTGQYGRIWIELTSVKINTTEKKNVAMFSDVQLEVRAESKYDPPMRFAKHLREHYAAYGEEFPIFAEVERAARIVAIARWLAENYPEVAQKLVDSSYENVKVFVPQAIPARHDFTHDTPLYKSWLIGGVVFPNVNKTTLADDAKVADTRLDEVAPKVLEAQKGDETAWELPLGSKSNEKYFAWCVSAMKPEKTHASLEKTELRVAEAK